MKEATENEVQDLYKEEPIRTEEEDRFGRSIYAKVIAETIVNSGGAFNFGISGEWGSGKSSVLNLVEPLLKKKNFLVVRFNPWKVATDVISIRRRFLIDLVAGLKAQGIKVELPENLRKSITRISDVEWREKFKIIGWTVFHFFLWFGAIGLIPLLGFYILDQIFAWVGLTVPSLSNFYYNILFLPAFGALIPTFRYYLARIRIERVDPEIEVAEQFEREFERIIKKTKRQRRGILNLVIFVDDLDRARPKDVMTIFSSIMTFFERKGITFLISADQKMVENIIEEELGEKSNPREFVKKLFQVNWIIPPIPIHLQEGFVRSNFPKFVATEKEIADRLAPDWIVNMVINEFGGNPRKVRYFMRELEFQIRAVKAMIEDIEKRASTGEINKAELENLKNIRKHPELLAKILIIRSSDRYANQWDTIVKEPQKILQEERGDSNVPEPLKAFLNSRPFFNDYDQNPQYYVYFSGITGFEERLLADPSHFAEFAKRGDMEKVKSIMQGTLDIHRVDLLNSIIARIRETKDQTERIHYARSFSQTLSMLEEYENRKRMLFKFFKAIEEIHKKQPILQSFQHSDYEGLVKNFDNSPNSLEQARKMLNQGPYIDQNTKQQVWTGFAAASPLLPPEILTIFCERLLQEMGGNENVQNRVFATLRQIGQNVAKTENSEEVMNKVVAILIQRPLGTKNEPLQTLTGCSDALTEKHKQTLTEHFDKFGTSGNIQDVLFVTQHLETIVNITKNKQVVNSLVRHSSSRNMSQRQQIIANLKSHQKFLGTEQRNEIIKGLIQTFKGQNQEECLKAINVFKGHIWIMPEQVSSRRKQLKEILGVIERKESLLTHELISMFYDIRSAWENDEIAKKKFLDILQDLRKDSDSNISNASNKILGKMGT